MNSNQIKPPSRKLASGVIGGKYQELRGWFEEDLPALRAALTNEPIPMLLYCPICGVQHVDAATETWTNPPHRSHLCHNCGCIWRPADVATTGVQTIETKGKNDNWVVRGDVKPAASSSRLESLRNWARLLCEEKNSLGVTLMQYADDWADDLAASQRQASK